MLFSGKAASAGSLLTVIVLSLAPAASAGPKEDVAAAAASWATALGTDDPETPRYGARCRQQCAPTGGPWAIIS